MVRHLANRHSTVAATAAFALSLLITSNARLAGAQGCEPIRFTAPVSLGGQGEAYQRSREWQLTLAYRYLNSNDFFVGTTNSTTAISPSFRIHTLVANAAYAINDRWNISASLPFSKGTQTSYGADKVFHEQRATGTGDLSIIGEGWVLEPRAHGRGNVAVAIGVKAPTGSHTIGTQLYSADGATTDFPASQTVQPGDGGWALLLQSRAFRQLTDRTHLYAFGSYMVSPKAQSDVRERPNGLYWSVPDGYSARTGLSYALLPDRDLSVSLGGRIDGTPVHDLVGGGDDVTVKRPAYVILADPGLSMGIGEGRMTMSVPYRVRVNRLRSVVDEKNGSPPVGGGFAKYLLFLSYSHPL